MKTMIRLYAGFFVLWLLFIKLFTCEIILDGDTTVGVVIRDKPSFENIRYRTDQKEANQMYYIITDENEYKGEDVYHFITEVGWIVGLIGGGGFLFGSIFLDNYKRFRTKAHKTSGRNATIH